VRRHAERDNLVFCTVLVEFRRRVATMAVKDKQTVGSFYLRFCMRIKVLNLFIS